MAVAVKVPFTIIIFEQWPKGYPLQDPMAVCMPLLGVGLPMNDGLVYVSVP